MSLRVMHVVTGRMNPASANGVERVVCRLAEGTAASGIPVAVVQRTPKAPIPIPGVEVKSITGRALSWSLTRALKRELIEWRPTVVHLHSTFSPLNVVAASLCRKHGIPYIVSPHAAISEERSRIRPVRKRLFLALFDKRLLESAARVHALTESERDDILAVAQARVIVIGNGVDVVAGNVCECPKPFDGDDPYFLYLGRLDYLSKGLDLLAEAYASLVRDVVEMPRLVLIGPDQSGSQARMARVLRSSGVHNRVTFMGRISDDRVRDCALSHSLAVIQPSRSEGMSLVALEAMAAGALSIWTVASSPFADSQSELPGFLCETTASSISAAMLAAMRLDPIRREMMSASGARLAKRHFSWEARVLEWVSVYSTAGEPVE